MISDLTLNGSFSNTVMFSMVLDNTALSVCLRYDNILGSTRYSLWLELNINTDITSTHRTMDISI